MFRNGCLLRFEEFYSKEVKIGLKLENPLLQWNTTHPSKGSGRVVAFCFQFWKSIKARALYMLAKHSTTEAYPKPLFFCFVWDKVSRLASNSWSPCFSLTSAEEPIHTFQTFIKFWNYFLTFIFQKNFLHFPLPFFCETKDKNIRFYVIVPLLFEPLLISFSFFSACFR